MALCSIPYINEIPLISDTEKQRLTKLHLDISKQLYRHRVDKKGFVDKVFHFTGTKLYVLGDGADYKAATDLINILNRDAGFEAVKLISDGEKRRYVSVDVRKDVSTTIDINNIDDMFAFHKNYFGDSAIITDDAEIEETVKGHEETFKELTDGAIEKINVYLRGLEDSGDDYKVGKTKTDLKFLVASLKDQSTYGMIEGLSKYILSSSYNLSKLQKRLNIIDEKVKSLSTNPATRKEQLREVADFVRHSSYYYHLFDKLGDIQRELITLGAAPKFIDSYERDLLERDLKEWMMDMGVFSEEEVIEFLNTVPTESRDLGRLYTQFKQRYKDKRNGVILSLEEAEKLQDEMLAIFDKNMKPDGSNLQKLFNLVSGIEPFREKIKDLHYDTLVEVYYPSFEASFDAGKFAIDGVTPLDTKWKISKKDFRTMISIAEEDVDQISMWGSAMINVKETFPMTIANYFKDVMIDADITNKEDMRGLQEFLTQNKRQQGDSVLKEIDNNLKIENLTIEAVEEVDNDYIPKKNEGIVTLKTMGIEKRYKARRTVNFLNNYNTIAYSNAQKAFSHNVDEVTETLANQIKDDQYALTYLKDSDDAVLKNLYDMMYKVNFKGEELITNYMGKFLSNDPGLDDIKGRIKGMLWRSFNKDNKSLKTVDEIESEMKKSGLLIKDELTDINNDENASARRFVLKNSYWTDYKEFDRGSTLQDTHHFSPETLFGIEQDGVRKVMVKYTDLSFGWVELITTGNGVIAADTSGKDIAQYATFNGVFNTLADKYKIENGSFGQEGANKWKYINDSGFRQEYFNKLVNLYTDGRNNYGMENLANREIPQVKRMEQSSKLKQAKELVNDVRAGKGSDRFYDYASTYLVEENKVPRMKNGVYVNEDGVEINEPEYLSLESQYVNGQKIRNISAKFTRPIDVDDLETDMYKSVLLYKTASNVYRSLKDNESQALLLQTVLEGDSTLGVEARKAKVKRHGVDMKIPGGGVKMTSHELRSSQMILSFINDYVYNISNEDSGILGTKISAKKVAGMISGYTAYTALAWNMVTMPSNRIIALANSRAVAKGNQWFNEQDWNESIKIYHKNLGGFMNDFRHKGFTNQKSQLTQLIIRFNAIQGEFLSPTGQIETKGLGEKLSDSALMWTQELPEHGNQTESMIMLMKGYKLTDQGGREVSLWQAIEEANINRKEGESVVMPSYFSREQEIEFQKRLHGVNRQIHGNYGKLDRNMMQKSIGTNMLMTFKKYIYDGFRSRFQGERYDIELRDEQEGYFRTYFKNLNKEFAEVAKTQGTVAALREGGLKSIGNFLLKTSLAGWDAALSTPWTGRISEQNESLKKFIYGENLSERQQYAALRATYDVGNIIRAMIMIAVAEAIMSGLDDDDDAMRFILQYADLYARKLESDLGFFTSFTNFGTGSFPGGATLDQTLKFLKQPMAAVRTMDNTAGIFKQLTDFDTINENGEFELSWGAFDKYDKSGNGFEKGDYKITKKIQKSIVSPWWQVIKVWNPDEQLKYQGMVTKYGAD